MRRRQFLGFIGGAAAAGPVVAREAITKGSLTAMAEGMPGSALGYSADELSATGGADWKLSRISQLKKFLSGNDPDEDRRSLRVRGFRARTRTEFGVRARKPRTRKDRQPSFCVFR